MLRQSFAAASGGLCRAPAAAAMAAGRPEETAREITLLCKVGINLPPTPLAAVADQGVAVEAVVADCRTGRRPAVSVDVALAGGGAAAIG